MVDIENLKEKFNNDPDLIVREIEVNKNKLTLIYLKSIVDKDYISGFIVEPIVSLKKEFKTVNEIEEEVLFSCEVKKVRQNQIKDEILNGATVLILNDEEEFLSFDTEKVPFRNITEPPTSAVIKGPREGFTENIKVNIALIRKRMRSEHLKLETLYVGRETKTQITLCYLENIADPIIVNKIKNKISKIKIDGIIDSYYITEFLEEKKQSIFKQIGNTEKPDIACAKMLEGRVVVLVDNTPIVLTLPYLLLEDLQDSSDYYNNHFRIFIVRTIRMLGILLAILSPGMYVAMLLYHSKVIPLNFFITIINSTQGLPFEPFIEVLFIIILFEILYEVSLRLPRYLGLATSIVGALVLGDTGVKAGLISPPGVMIVALSGIAIYAIPDQSGQESTLRLLFLFLGGIGGFLGILTGLVFIVSFMNKHDGYGAPYLAPLTPYIKEDMKDFIFKKPITELKTRPLSFNQKNKVRLEDNEESIKYTSI